jgi:hypothetical protein
MPSKKLFFYCRIYRIRDRHLVTLAEEFVRSYEATFKGTPYLSVIPLSSQFRQLTYNLPAPVVKLVSRRQLQRSRTRTSCIFCIFCFRPPENPALNIATSEASSAALPVRFRVRFNSLSCAFATCKSVRQSQIITLKPSRSLKAMTLSRPSLQWRSQPLPYFPAA